MNESINYNKKLSYFSGLSDKFEKENQLDRGWYLPRWEENAIWAKQHFRNSNWSGTEQEKKGFKEKFPTIESFKNYCFEKVRTEMSSCNSSNLWCMECARDKSWDNKK